MSTPGTPTPDTELQRLAKEARPGPWRVYESMQADTFVLVGEKGLLADDVICGPTYEQRNARFIAAASPDVVLGLLDRLAAVAVDPEAPTAETWQEAATRAGWMSPEANEGEIPWEFFAKHAGWTPPVVVDPGEAAVTDEMVEAARDAWLMFEDSTVLDGRKWSLARMRAALVAALAVSRTTPTEQEPDRG